MKAGLLWNAVASVYLLTAYWVGEIPGVLMAFSDAIRSDLEGMINGLNDYGVFEPGEAEAWREEVAEAEYVGEMMTLNEALVEAMEDRERFQEFMQNVEFVEKRAYPEK